MKLSVYAKINLSLNVGESSNGFHHLDTVMASVDISDVLSVTPRSDGKINVKLSKIKDAEKTNAYKAARLLRQYNLCGGADIFIEQRIPTSAGLGGSSADAAGVIRALAELYDIPPTEQIRVASLIGSDVPYMLKGGFARLNGTHSELSYFDGCVGEVLLFGQGSVNTGECFRIFDKRRDNGMLSDNELLINKLQDGDFLGASRLFSNALYPAAAVINPEIERIKNKMEECGLAACMTGSGSFVFGVGEEAALEKARNVLPSAIKVKLLPYGVNIL